MQTQQQNRFKYAQLFIACAMLVACSPESSINVERDASLSDITDVGRDQGNTRFDIIQNEDLNTQRDTEILQKDANILEDVGADMDLDVGVSKNCSPTRPWECILDDVIGHGRNTTGGAGADLCWVENLNTGGEGSLKSCLASAGPTWIAFRVSGTIQVDEIIPSNTTIDGRGQRIVLESPTGYIFQTNQDNIILTHLLMQNARFDPLRTYKESNNIWINHVTLSDSEDELLDIASSDTTISWCNFHDNIYALLVSDSDNRGTAPNITMHHNYFTKIFERTPMNTGRVHSYNNFIDGYEYSAAQTAFGGHIYSERNIYRRLPGAVEHAILSTTGGAITIPGHFRSVDDLFLDGAAANSPNDPTPVVDPATQYTYQSDVADLALQTRLKAETGWQDVALPLP